MPYDTHRRNILFTIAKLQDVPALEGNYFVYAHIIAPHPPFVFNEKGKVVSHDTPFTLNDANYYIRDHSQRSYIAGYRRQIQYVNQLVLETVDGRKCHLWAVEFGDRDGSVEGDDRRGVGADKLVVEGDDL